MNLLPGPAAWALVIGWPIVVIAMLVMLSRRRKVRAAAGLHPLGPEDVRF